MPAVADLLAGWVPESWVVVDPFARDSRRGTVRNDLNPDTLAESHEPALAFAKRLRGLEADCILFDPPYSLVQAKRSYQSAGVDFTYTDTLNAVRWSKEKDALTQVLRIGGTAICFGWDSTGFGKSRGFELLEVVLLCHGPGHHDTIITREVRRDAA
jgi:hypothetical protein